MIVQDVIHHLEKLAPLAYAEDFDNVGLLVGQKTDTVTGILITLDTLPEVVDEAISKNCNLIVSFHPIIFKGLKSITGKTYVERTVQKAIKNDIAIFAIHTALDNSFEGVSAALSNALGLKNRTILIPQQGTIKKLTTYIPKQQAEIVRNALFEAGGGAIGNYNNCSFNTLGQGTFKGTSNSNPTIGKPNELNEVEEIQLNIVFNKHLESKILKALFESHPYEEVAYEINSIDNEYQKIGMGMIGELENPMEENEFLEFVKSRLNCKVIRHSKLLEKPISKIAVLGGSGSFGIDKAKSAGVDAYLTADLKYHDFFMAEAQILLLDVGHYESEQYTKNLLGAYLTKKIPNFAVLLSKINTNPVNYK